MGNSFHFLKTCCRVIHSLHSRWIRKPFHSYYTTFHCVGRTWKHRARCETKSCSDEHKNKCKHMLPSMETCHSEHVLSDTLLASLSLWQSYTKVPYSEEYEFVKSRWSRASENSNDVGNWCWSCKSYSKQHCIYTYNHTALCLSKGIKVMELSQSIIWIQTGAVHMTDSD